MAAQRSEGLQVEYERAEVIEKQIETATKPGRSLLHHSQEHRDYVWIEMRSRK